METLILYLDIDTICKFLQFCVTGGEKCEPRKVGLTLTNETWTQSLLNRDSIEFKTLEYNILPAVSTK